MECYFSHLGEAGCFFDDKVLPEHCSILPCLLRHSQVLKSYRDCGFKCQQSLMLDCSLGYGMSCMERNTGKSLV